MKVEFLWSDDCPNHTTARDLLQIVLDEHGIDSQVEDIDASDPQVADKVRFPGSPTIRIDGVDVEPGFIDPGEYTPGCRIYFTSSGLAGVPERRWIEMAVNRVHET